MPTNTDSSLVSNIDRSVVHVLLKHTQYNYCHDQIVLHQIPETEKEIKPCSV